MHALIKIPAESPSAFLGQNSVKLSFFRKNQWKLQALSDPSTARSASGARGDLVYLSLSKGVKELQTPEKYGQFLALV
jgi:hypothetical protein